MQLTEEQQVIWDEFERRMEMSEEDAIAYVFNLIKAMNSLGSVMDSHAKHTADPTWLLGGMG
jgi:hypothetical protein